MSYDQLIVILYLNMIFQNHLSKKGIYNFILLNVLYYHVPCIDKLSLDIRIIYILKMLLNVTKSNN